MITTGLLLLFGGIVLDVMLHGAREPLRDAGMACAFVGVAVLAVGVIRDAAMAAISRLPA